MHTPNRVRHFALSSAAALATVLILAACAGGTSAGWTYAPLGPTPAPTESAAPSPGESPAGSPSASGGAGVTVDILTSADDPLAFQPAEFSVPAGASVTVNYTNESNLPHDVQTFDGPDSSSDVLGATEIITGPGAQSSMTFTAPTDPGTYFFWCSVHQQAMTGTYTVQ